MLGINTNLKLCNLKHYDFYIPVKLFCDNVHC